MEQLKLPGNEIIRGEAPENIEQRCLTLCQDYIGGVWKTAKTTENITVTRITGGLTNQLYRVQLNSAQKCADTNSNDVPTDVAVKLYIKKHVTIGDDGVDDRLNDNIVLTLMSQTKIGPRVLGIFKEGNIQVFHEVGLATLVFAFINLFLFVFSMNFLAPNITRIQMQSVK